MAGRRHVLRLLWGSLLVPLCRAIAVPSSAPLSAALVDPSLLSVSLEFFAFPGYTTLAATSNCLANLATLRGAQPAIRIGGTTQDRATFYADLDEAVNYTVASPADAPDSLTFGPPFMALAAQLKGEVTLGLNRQLDNQSASLAAAALAKETMPNLFAVELGNEPEFYASNSPIIVDGGQGWNQNVDAASEKSWFETFSRSVGNIFQGAVTLSWSAGETLTLIGSDGAALLKSLSRHSYPQSACGGASTNLPSLMNHSGIVSYTRQYRTEAAQAHAASIKYFLGETNSATCGGGGISPTFGAALWIVDYVLQGALNGVDRLYFHQGTISDCAYCFWGQSSVFAPYYGAAFVSEFLGSNGVKAAMLDDGTGAIGVYAAFNASNSPVRLLIINTDYYSGTGTPATSVVTLSGAGSTDGTKLAKRMTAPDATSTSGVTIGGSASFAGTCARSGAQTMESVTVSGGTMSVSVRASEALIVFL
ncbi:glycoside hydrolase family 79 protein [Phanerochaete carnosa HHB-10118-sp]|uniref:Glycoside hydrolase family 79 protein n=1 Tax=Phanerochaete carnosa (strain HHB-10118-sp) TaxID=650164 RepID=K5VRP6_PHACS|nr:glycoside hydrolase family 79 protein [Phanerochaete carnosa HHB-10118-sp]EKM54178.1 glycoside hydrolase family 79 protein [Phanerochaete carnosa HHB-10118-sp]